jgi:hydrogenase expression/formation protein HypE
LVLVAAEAAERVFELMHRHPLGRQAAIIGEVTGDGDGRVELETLVGGRRAVEMLSGEQLPRIC